MAYTYSQKIDGKAEKKEAKIVEKSRKEKRK
jgi:hypothetical protein